MPLPAIDKALLKPNEKVFVINPQKNQPEIKNTAKAMDLADAVVLWATREAHLPKNQEALDQVPAGATLWVCYPKPGKLETDLGRDKLWIFMKGRGFEPVRVVSVDDTWAAFSFKK
ncbi:MAG: hypothetical protein ABR567_23145 [Myxococcales bacterium]|nr:hypothetical protein [Myxococcales bacterium]